MCGRGFDARLAFFKTAGDRLAGSIRGQVFRDDDEDGVLDPSEVGIAGTTVSLANITQIDDINAGISNVPNGLTLNANQMVLADVTNFPDRGTVRYRTTGCQ